MLIESFINSVFLLLTHSLTHWVAHWLTGHVLTDWFTYSVTLQLTHSVTQWFTCWLIDPHTDWVIHSLTPIYIMTQWSIHSLSDCFFTTSVIHILTRWHDSQCTELHTESEIHTLIQWFSCLFTYSVTHTFSHSHSCVELLSHLLLQSLNTFTKWLNSRDFAECVANR